MKKIWFTFFRANISNQQLSYCPSHWNFILILLAQVTSHMKPYHPLIKKKIPIWWFIEWGKTTCCHLGSLLYTRYSPLLRLRPLSLPPSYTTISIEKILHYIWASYDKKVNKTIQQKHSRTAEKKVLASFSGRDICTFGHSLLVNSNLHERCPINLLRSQHGTFLQNERKTGNITNIFLASGL